MMMRTDNDPRGNIRFTAPGTTRKTYLKRVDVCTNRPVGTSRKNALVLSIPRSADLFSNMQRRGYNPVWVHAVSKWTVAPDSSKGGYAVYRDGMYADYDNARGLSYADAVAALNALRG